MSTLTSARRIKITVMVAASADTTRTARRPDATVGEDIQALFVNMTLTNAHKTRVVIMQTV